MKLIDIIYIFVYAVMIYCSILWFGAYLKNRKIIFKIPKAKRFPSITFLIPAYNAEKTIKKTIDSLFNLKYPKKKMKIIVIDDGSTDNTAKIAKQYKNVKLIRQKHGGKGSALNNGLKHVKTELVACMDADSLPEKDYLLKMVGYLEKKDVAAVTPALKVAETDSLMRKIQWVEYLFSIFLRKVFSIFQSQYVVPGPGGIYKASALKKVGGFDENSLTEDMEIAFKLIDSGYRLENSISAFVDTDCPKNFKGLYKQRIRWYRGYWQNVKKYSYMIGNLKYGNLGFFLLPINFVWMFVLAFLFFTPIILGIKNSIEYFINWSYIGYAIMLPEIRFDIIFLDFFTFFNALFLVLNLIVIWVSVRASREKIELKKRIKFYLAFLFIYPVLISIFWILSMIFELFGVKRKW
jgi:cellulose synthase/poly-beta-1,6-N-acetylglucosamine synthase-like glycosyltransferase